jgi:NADH:ubiquinone oxidoreductase subunit 6 (subunit J)
VRGNGRRSFLLDAAPQRGYRIPPLIFGAPQLLRRHLPLYAVVAAFAILAEWLVYRVSQAPAVTFASSIVIGAVVDAIVFAQVKDDLDGTGSRETWSRVLERLWAVVVANFVATYVTVFGISAAAAGDLTDRIIPFRSCLWPSG